MKNFLAKIIKGAASGGLMFFLYLAIWNLPIIFLIGGEWAAKWLLLPLYIASAILFTATLLVTPLAMVRRYRHMVGTTLVLFSMVYGFIAWYLGFILGYLVWGEWGAVSGILLFVFGVMPVGMLASYMDGDLVNLTILFMVTLLFIDTRFIGKKLQKPTREKAELDENSAELWSGLENWSRP